MPKTRIEVARRIYESFRAAEDAAERSAVAAARCVADLIEARADAKLHPAMGAEIMALVSGCSVSALEARRQVVAAHPMLEALARDLGVVGYGPDKEPVPNQPIFTGANAPLRVIAGAG